MTRYNGVNAMKGAFWGIAATGGGVDCSCYHDSSWVCADEVQYDSLCVDIGSGATGSITATVPKDAFYSSLDCLQFTSSQTTGAPIASVNPTKAPTTISPVYTLFNGVDTGFCLDSFGEFYSAVASKEIGTETGGACTQFPGDSPALAYCSDWCSE